MQELRTFLDELDLYSLTHPTSVEHFIMNLVIVAALAGVAWVLFKLLARLF